MGSVSDAAFVVSKILYNLVSIQKALLAAKCSVTNAQGHLTFPFIKLFENLNSFVQISLVIEKKYVAKSRLCYYT